MYLNFNYLGRWRGDYWVAKEFYYNNNIHNAELTGTYINVGSIPYIPHRYFKDKKNKNIYLLQRKSWTAFSLKKVKELKDLTTQEISSDYQLFQLNINTIDEWKNFLITLKNQLPESLRFSIYETLIYYAAIEQNKLLFDKLLDEYEKLNPKPINEYYYEVNPFKLDFTTIIKENSDYFKQNWIEILENRHSLP
jgi:hypothetical protein